MTEYLLYFNQQWVGDHTEEWFARARTARQGRVEEMKAAGVYVFAGGLEEEDGPVYSADATSGERVDHRRPVRRDQGVPGRVRVVDVPDDETAKLWAGKIAEACGWPHEARRSSPAPEVQAAVTPAGTGPARTARVTARRPGTVRSRGLRRSTRGSGRRGRRAGRTPRPGAPGSSARWRACRAGAPWRAGRGPPGVASARVEGSCRHSATNLLVARHQQVPRVVPRPRSTPSRGRRRRGRPTTHSSSGQGLCRILRNHQLSTQREVLERSRPGSSWSVAAGWPAGRRPTPRSAGGSWPGSSPGTTAAWWPRRPRPAGRRGQTRCRRSLPHRPVDRLAQHVGVSVVTRVLLDHVDDDPAQAERRALATARRRRPTCRGRPWPGPARSPRPPPARPRRTSRAARPGCVLGGAQLPVLVPSKAPDRPSGSVLAAGEDAGEPPVLVHAACLSSPPRSGSTAGARAGAAPGRGRRSSSACVSMVGEVGAEGVGLGRRERRVGAFESPCARQLVTTLRATSPPIRTTKAGHDDDEEHPHEAARPRATAVRAPTYPPTRLQTPMTRPTCQSTAPWGTKTHESRRGWSPSWPSRALAEASRNE